RRTSSSSSRATRLPELYFWSRATTPEHRPQEGMVQRIVATEKTCLVVVELAPQTVVESHKHDVDQLGTVVKGQVVMVIAGEQRVDVADVRGSVQGRGALPAPRVHVGSSVDERADDPYVHRPRVRRQRRVQWREAECVPGRGARIGAGSEQRLNDVGAFEERRQS